MGKTREFLEELNDYELAFFVKFKLSTYMKDTQLEIKEFILDKGLTENQIEKLVSAKPKRELKNGNERCPRCSTEKIRTEKVEWTNTIDKKGFEDEIATIDGLSGKATYKNQVICNVCGLWIEDPNFEKKKKSFWQNVAGSIFDLFTQSI